MASLIMYYSFLLSLWHIVIVSDETAGLMIRGPPHTDLYSTHTSGE